MTLAAQLMDNLETASWQEAVDNACRRIAPSWPLDQAIAVNPWWGWRDTAFSKVSASLYTQGRIRCLMPGEWYRERWQNPIKAEHLDLASKELGVSASVDELLASLNQTSEGSSHWYNIADLLDEQPERRNRFAWHEEIVQQISQFCGLYFTYPDRIQTDGDSNTLYRAWLEVVRHDRGMEVLMAETGLNRLFKRLPENPDAIFEAMHAQCNYHPEFEKYAHSLLLDIHGWAAWLAYQGWQKSFAKLTDNGVMQLLAIRMAWDYMLLEHVKAKQPALHDSVIKLFNEQFDQQLSLGKFYLSRQRHLWVWQRAVEMAYQSKLHRKLANPAAERETVPRLQAVFCIDVRSEPMRRALEAQSDEIRTLGFAGFFGLPLAYQTQEHEYRRSQTPGLLAPSIEVCQKHNGCHVVGSDTRDILRKTSHSPTAAFGIVEAFGLGKVYSLIKQSWFAGRAEHPVNDNLGDGEWQLLRDGNPLSNGEKASLVSGILTNMGLTKQFAPVVLFVGHTSSTANNPQRAALECGACGGQSGEINARVLAQLLNEPGVRLALQGQGIKIPQTTRFYAAVHDTTLDQISCFETSGNEVWLEWLDAAGKQAGASRATSLGLRDREPLHVQKQYLQRSKDWAQVRPEWGLANNAAFIVAKRDHTRHLDLEGRCFLHDYDWQEDPGFKILESIMTAPMLVTNWINLQYYASVTDNQRYGSGNKLLHNVVGGNIGVFEGNGGDLRIGLAKQSVHDGKQWRHEPLRLSVYLDAPEQAVATIIDRHSDLAQLINNDWLYLFQWDSKCGRVQRYYQGKWLAVTNRHER